MSQASKILIGFLAISTSGTPFGLPSIPAYASAKDEATADLHSNNGLNTRTENRNFNSPPNLQDTNKGRQFAQPNNTNPPSSSP